MNPNTDLPEPSDGTKADTPSLDLFIQRLSDSGLMTVEEVQGFIERLPKERRLQTADEMAKEMVHQGTLTKFQAQAVYLGKTRGMVVGNYVVHDQLGKGGMGYVYKARHKWMDRVVAIKLLPPAATKSADAVQRFQREVRAAARLTHPNIVTAYDADSSDGVFFLVMEFVDGKDLGRLVKERGPLGVSTAVNYVIQAAQGLEYAHGQGVIHRDVKPANLLLDKSGKVKILDMGLARMDETVGEYQSSTEETPSRRGHIMGTLDYMAPEQAQDTQSADARADVYALGCTFHYLLCGRKPYGGDTVTQKIVAHRDLPIPSLRAIRPDVPEWIDTVFQRMLAKRPEDRPQSMAELIVQLQQEPLGQSGVAVDSPPIEAPPEAMDSQSSVADIAPPPVLPPIPGLSSPAVPPAIAELPTVPTYSAATLRRKRPTRKAPWVPAIAAGGTIFVLAIVGAIFLRSNPEGTLIVKLAEPDVVVQVLSEEGDVQLERMVRQEKVSLTIASGKHQLRLQKDGTFVFSREFDLAPGGEETIEAAWKSASAKKDPPQPKPAEPKPEAVTAPVPPPKPPESKSALVPAPAPQPKPPESKPPVVAAPSPRPPENKSSTAGSPSSSVEPAKTEMPAESAEESPAKAGEESNSTPAPAESRTSAPQPPADQKDAVTIKLTPVNGLQRMGIRYRTIHFVNLSARPGRAIRVEPKYSGRPLYGTINLGDAPDNGVAVVVDDSLSQPRIYVDRNRDGDLTNDGPGTWTNINNNQYCRLEEVVIDVPYRTGVIPSMFLITHSLRNNTNRIEISRDSGREGEIVSDGKRYKVLAICSSVNNGRYDNLNQLDLLIDLNGDGTISGDYRSAERHRMSEPMNIQGKVWQVVSMSADGTLMTICPSNAQVAMHLYLEPGLPAPPFTAPGLDGSPVDLQSLASGSRYVLLYFWNSAPFRSEREFPAIHHIQEEYGNRGLRVVGVSLEVDCEKAKRTVEEASLTFPHVFDGKGFQGEAATLYRAFPGDMGLFDKDLKIVLWARGLRMVEEQLNNLLNNGAAFVPSASPTRRPNSTAKNGADTPASPNEALNRRVYLAAPYPGLRPGIKIDQILVPNAVQEICKQAGVNYNVDKAKRSMGAVATRRIRPDIQGKPASEALNLILEPLGLAYHLEDGELVIEKGTKPKD
jgi:serine/threonine protein kinase/peroxiredoxin